MLASAQYITQITPINDADTIETAQVLGWQVVVKKGDFNVGDLVTYIQIDTIVPEAPEFEFLRPRSFRVKTIKLRKQISQGLIMPLPKGKWKEGDNLTDVLGIIKFSKEAEIKEPRPAVPKKWHRKFIYIFKYKFLYKYFPNLEKKTKLPFPTQLVHKTDEERIQNMPRILEEYKGKQFVATEKINGCSITIIYDNTKKDPYRICSRNFEMLTPDNQWTKTFTENMFHWQIQKLIDYYGQNLVVQGELYGTVQGNYYKCEPGHNFIKLFNIFVDGERLPPEEMVHVASYLGVPTCPAVWAGPLNFTMNDIIKFAEGKSLINPKVEREGLVFRSIDGKVSFKVVSNKYLIKNDE